MAGFSVTYITLTILLYQHSGFGDSAVVYAHALNLGARILYCGWFISSYLARQNSQMSEKMSKAKEKADLRFRWRDTLPRAPVLLVFAMAAISTRASAKSFNILAYTNQSGWRILLVKPCMRHLGVGVVSGLVCLAVW